MTMIMGNSLARAFGIAGAVFAPREISQSDAVTVKCHRWLDSRTSFDRGVQLMAGGAGVKAAAWEHPKRERA
jgi:hypothetical protein